MRKIAPLVILYNIPKKLSILDQKTQRKTAKPLLLRRKKLKKKKEKKKKEHTIKPSLMKFDYISEENPHTSQAYTSYMETGFEIHIS